MRSRNLPTEFAVKLPGCRRSHPTNSPVAIGSKWQVFASKHVALAQPSHLRNSACSSNIVGLLAMHPVGEVFTVSYDIIYYLFLFYLRNCIPISLNQETLTPPNGG